LNLYYYQHLLHRRETPARKVVNGLADFCIAPSESVISCWTSDPAKVKPIVVATLLQHDTSAIVTKATSSVKTLAELDKKLYASYEGRFEMAIVQQMIRQAGGMGEAIETTPPKLDCFDAVMRGDAEATWVFMAWEGVMAEMKGVELNVFDLKTSGVPYGYSPVLLAHPDMLSADNGTLLQSFLAVTQRGYQFATEQPEAAAICLMETAQHHALTELGQEMIIKSQQYLSNGNYYLHPSGEWGTMETTRWVAFLDWLATNKLLVYRDGTTVPREALREDEMCNRLV